MTKASRDNKANQMNPNNTAYAASRASTKASDDNRKNQLNPNNDAYRKSRGTAGPPEDSNNYPGAWVDYTSMQPPSPPGNPPAGMGSENDPEERKRGEKVEALVNQAISSSPDEFLAILNAAVEKSNEDLIEALMKRRQDIPAEQLTEIITKIMFDGRLYLQYHIIPYTDPALLVDLVLNFDLSRVPSGGPLGPNYSRFYRDYIGYYISRGPSKVMPKLVAALSEGSAARQFLAATLIMKVKDPELSVPEIHLY